MRDLSELAEQLWTVRQASRRFLSRWAVESTMIYPALDRVVADVNAAVAQTPPGPRDGLDRQPPPADKS